MKKLIIIVMLFVLSGCTLFQSELEKAITNLEKAESYRMDITLSDIPLFGSVTVVGLTDGDYQKISTSMSLFGASDTITFEKDGIKYEISEYNDEYIAVVSNETEDSDDGLLSGTSDFINFDPKDFTKDDDGYYTSLKNYDEVIDLKIKVENNYITEAQFRMESEGMTVSVLIEFSGFNSTEIEIPEFRYLDEFETAVYNLEQQGYTYSREGNILTFNYMGTTITYSAVSKMFNISNWFSQESSFNSTTESNLSESEFETRVYADYIDYDTYLELIKVSKLVTLE